MDARFKRLLAWVAGPRAAARAVSEPADPQAQLPLPLVYPPVDPGLPVVPPAALLQARAATLSRLRELVAPGGGGLGPAWLAPVEAFAQEVHLLPASAQAHYAAPGGLFHAGLDVAFHALQAAEGRIFTAEAARRHELEPRWRYAIFLAGLAWPARSALAQLSVADDRGREWAPLAGPLWTWLQAGGAQRYFPGWWPGGGVPVGAALLERIAPRERLDWLAAGDVRLLQELHQAAGGGAQDGPVARLVAEVGERVLHADALRQRSRYGRLAVGCHLEPYLLDALRAPVESGAWPLNEAGSPLWWAADGVFVEWPAAHADVLRVFLERGWAGLPRSPWTLAEVLGRAGALLAAADGRWVHEVALPAADGARAGAALRFADPACLLALHPGRALPRPLLAAAQPASAPAVAEAPGAVRPSASCGSGGVGADRAASAVHAASAASAASTASAENVPGIGRAAPAPVRIPAARWLRSAALRDAVQQLADYHHERPGDAVQWHAWGVALRIDWIAQHSAVPLAEWVLALEANGWLARPPGCRNPAARVHEVAFGGARVQALVLSAAGGAALGLRGEGAVP